MDIRITLPDGRSMREALAELVQHCREERDHCDENGRSSRAECFERIAVAIEELPPQREAAEESMSMGEIMDLPMTFAAWVADAAAMPDGVREKWLTDTMYKAARKRMMRGDV